MKCMLSKVIKVWKVSGPPPPPPPLQQTGFLESTHASQWVLKYKKTKSGNKALTSSIEETCAFIGKLS